MSSDWWCCTKEEKSKFIDGNYWDVVSQWPPSLPGTNFPFPAPRPSPHCTMQCTLHSEHWTLKTENCTALLTLKTETWTLNTDHCIPQWTLSPPQWTLCSISQLLNCDWLKALLLMFCASNSILDFRFKHKKSGIMKAKWWNTAFISFKKVHLLHCCFVHSSVHWIVVEQQQLAHSRGGDGGKLRPRNWQVGQLWGASTSFHTPKNMWLFTQLFFQSYFYWKIVKTASICACLCHRQICSCVKNG